MQPVLDVLFINSRHNFRISWNMDMSWMTSKVTQFQNLIVLQLVNNM